VGTRTDDPCRSRVVAAPTGGGATIGARATVLRGQSFRSPRQIANFRDLSHTECRPRLQPSLTGTSYADTRYGFPEIWKITAFMFHC
jgi:hypothetical protein